MKRYLSKGGNNVLIKSTLLSIHTYFTSGSSQCYKELRRFQRNFQLDSANGARKLHLVWWDLGDCYNFYVLGWPWAKDFKAFNTTLLAKW
uniref:Putative ovule protein n=1 Tax=Solanum chacoense TaxID=4108 RepID=A0A0V0GXZ9_SOLCH